jgi:hypothetical protein
MGRVHVLAVKHTDHTEVVFDEAGESAKYHGDVYAPRIPLKSPKGESHEVQGRCEQREAPVHRLKDVIEEQRHSDHARERDAAPCDIEPAAIEDLGECCRQ